MLSDIKLYLYKKRPFWHGIAPNFFLSMPVGHIATVRGLSDAAQRNDSIRWKWRWDQNAIINEGHRSNAEIYYTIIPMVKYRDIFQVYNIISRNILDKKSHFRHGIAPNVFPFNPVGHWWHNPNKQLNYVNIEHSTRFFFFFFFFFFIW